VNAPEAISKRPRRRTPGATRVKLPPVPLSARRARDVVRAIVGSQDDGRVALVTSELVTNAVVHAHTAIELTVDVGPDQVMIEVHDEASSPPRGRDVLPHNTGGRGLALVATLADDWGVHPDPVGKTVWAILHLGLDAPKGPAPDP
jgi:anti-sigma regulatory factor (Ser/Thr protein kinase)